MTLQPAQTEALLAAGQQRPVGSQASDALGDATTGRTTPPKPTTCLQESIKADIKTLAAYLVKESAPEAVQAALDRISDAYDRRVQQKTTTEQAISQLHAAVQELANKVENKLYEPAKTNSYAAVAGQGLPTQTRPQQSLNAGHVTPQKQIPLRHKREIVVVRGFESLEEKRRTYKELLK